MSLHENDQVEPISVLEGHVVRGQGRAADFTKMDWVRRQLIDLVGIDPHPGTLNLALQDEVNRMRWRSWRSMPSQVLESEDGASCHARCYPVRITGHFPAAVLVPGISGYPEDKVELVAALPIRKHLSLSTDTRIRVELCRPLAAKAVLFDIDGTLVDSVGAYLEVARVASEPFGFAVTKEHVCHSLATGSNFWKGIVPKSRRDGNSIEKTLSANAAREWPRVLREFGEVFKGVAQTLDELKSLGIRLGIVSGARPDVLELLQEEDILARFDAVILGADVSKSKPDPEGIIKCLLQLNITPDEAIYVGDTPVDIQASRAAGVRVVSVLTGAGDSALLSKHCPDRLISSHARLTDIVENA
jgi:phosphoglycolate phosphatase